MLSKLASGMFLRYLFIIISLLFSLQLAASPNVPSNHPVYRDIEKLKAFGLLKKYIHGHRPWSEKEVVRLLLEAEENFEKKDTKYVERLDKGQYYILSTLKKWKRVFKGEVARQKNPQDKKLFNYVRPLSQISLEYALVDSPFRDIPFDNGAGVMDAQINPLIDGREGRKYTKGSNLSIESEHILQAGKLLTFYLRPRFQLLNSFNGADEVSIDLLNAYGKFNIKNFELQLGRDNLLWGHGLNGGMLQSNNARGLDLIKLGSSAPFYHPWIFKGLGPSKYTFFVANLGPERALQYAYVYGLNASIRPSSWFELSISQTLTIGGEGGGAELRWFDPILEFFFIRRGGIRGQGSQNADRRNTISALFEIPKWRGVNLHVELQWDDLGRETIHANFTQIMGFQLGVNMPLLTLDGKTHLKAEWNHIPALFYRHSKWQSGHTLNRRIIGSEVGPDADQFLLSFGRQLSDDHHLKVDLSYENIDSDDWTQTPSSNNAPDQLVVVNNNPTEHRFRIESELDWQINQRWSSIFGLGYERVHNFNFVPGNSLNNFLAQVSITYRPALK